MSAQLLCLSVCFLRLRLPPVSLPACFSGASKSPQPPSPLCSHAPYTHSASSALLLNEFHMALQAAVSVRLAEERSRQAPSTHKHTHTHGPKVQRSLPADLENATVWKWPLAQSKHTYSLPAWLPCVELSTESEGRMHTNVVWLDCWWAENAGSLTGWLTGLSIWNSSWASKCLADWHVLWLIKATLNYCNLMSLF